MQTLLERVDIARWDHLEYKPQVGGKKPGAVKKVEPR